MIFALGRGDLLVGASELSDYPPEARTIPRVGGFSRPNPETILALRPDLLVVSPRPRPLDRAHSQSHDPQPAEVLRGTWRHLPQPLQR